ncbi:hypothetical protein Q7P37_005084 [Cladosporium fusiforme]
MSFYPNGCNDAYVDDGTYDDDLDDDGQDDDYVEDDGPAQAPKSTRKSTKGRQLKRWDADEDQLLLLFCDYVCTNEGTPMPWDKIAATMEPRNPEIGEQPMTGEAVKQHLAKIRQHREKKGRRVPPKLDRSARRTASGGKAATATATATTSLETPAPTPTKTARAAPGGGNAARGKAQTNTVNPPAKVSTLLADVSKSKQRKEKQALRAQQAQQAQVNGEGIPARAAGTKAGAKRGRKQSAVHDPDDDYGATQAAIGSTKSRRSEPKNHGKATKGEFEDIGIKDENLSDEEPLATKKIKLRYKPTKPNASKSLTKTGVMQDTLDLWNDQGSNIGSRESQAQPADNRVAGQFVNEGVGTPSNKQSFNIAQMQVQPVRNRMSGEVVNEMFTVPSNDQAYNVGQIQGQTAFLDAGGPNSASSLQHDYHLPVGTPHTTAASHVGEYFPQFTSSPVNGYWSSPSFNSSGFGHDFGSSQPQTSSGDTSLSSSFASSTDDPFLVSPNQANGGIGGLPISPLNIPGGTGSLLPPNPYAREAVNFQGSAGQYLAGYQPAPTHAIQQNDVFMGGFGNTLPQMAVTSEDIPSTFNMQTTGPTVTADVSMYSGAPSENLNTNSMDELFNGVFPFEFHDVEGNTESS